MRSLPLPSRGGPPHDHDYRYPDPRDHAVANPGGDRDDVHSFGRDQAVWLGERRGGRRREAVCRSIVWNLTDLGPRSAAGLSALVPGHWFGLSRLAGVDDLLSRYRHALICQSFEKE